MRVHSVDIQLDRLDNTPVGRGRQLEDRVQRNFDVGQFL